MMRDTKQPPADVGDLEREPVGGDEPPTGTDTDWRRTLRVLVFATEQPEHPETAAPFVVIPDAAGSFLPAHPGGLEWRYFATMRLDDQLLAGNRTAIEAAFGGPGYFVSERSLAR